MRQNKRGARRDRKSHTDGSGVHNSLKLLIRHRLGGGNNACAQYTHIYTVSVINTVSL